ncbi:MAG TPA: PilT/PilU family type 4a pilus ATPase [Kofleriaceae bacterium]|nr:PilT/PilU family type 4a pilus ATPase [Kofleriaceae bacterium]
MSQLAKLVELLDRDDVTEVVVATGRPVAVRSGGEYRPISRAAVSRAQLGALVAGTPLAALVDDGLAQRAVELDGRAIAVEVQPLGAELMLRLMRAPRAKRPTRQRPPSQSGARAKSPTQSGARARSPSSHGHARVAPPTRGGSAAPAAELVELVGAARRGRATDLHLAPDQPAMVRQLGTFQPLGEVLAAAQLDAMLGSVLDAEQQARLDERGYVDCALDLPGGRLRANLSRVRGGLKASFRLVAPAPSSLDALGLPRELAKVTTYHQGLVVIAGPSGHGKTTTLAALVDLINASKAHHILTIEDPVEIIHPRKRALVSQREVGRHTRSFATALKASLREDPDVIVIGELRDRETVEIALTAAETGHLVMATMSTPSAAKTLDRLIDMFPPDDQQQVRVSLAAALKFVVAQRLLPTADGAGVVAAVELLTGVLPLAALIRDNKLFQVGSLQQRGRAFGMIRLDDSLAELVRAGSISEDAALRAAENRRELTNVLRQKRGGA